MKAWRGQLRTTTHSEPSSSSSSSSSSRRDSRFHGKGAHGIYGSVYFTTNTGPLHLVCAPITTNTGPLHLVCAPITTNTGPLHLVCAPITPNTGPLHLVCAPITTNTDHCIYYLLYYTNSTTVAFPNKARGLAFYAVFFSGKAVVCSIVPWYLVHVLIYFRSI